MSEVTREEHIIDYVANFNRGSRGEVLLALALLGGGTRFSSILRLVGGKAKSTINHTLNVLERNGLITRSDDGMIRLRYKTPLCSLVDCEDITFAYLGLLGERSGREESETETALNILRHEYAINPGKVVVITTRKAAVTWENLMKPSIEWILMDDRDVSDLGRILEATDPKVRELASSHRLIMDCTSLTKPATIAFYKSAMKHFVPLIYIYEQSKKLTWIISRKDLETAVFGEKAADHIALVTKLRNKKRSDQ